MNGVFPQVVFRVFGIPVRDTVVSTWIMMVIIVGAAAVIGRRRPMALEMLVDFLIDTISGAMGRPAEPYLPLLGTLAIFIAVANVIGAVPIIVTPTRDINTPLALALVVFFSVHYFGIRAKGVVGYFKDMASPIFMLPLEIVGQLSRTLSLTLRLFGNVLSTELIVAVVFALLPLIVPLPLIAFSMFTGVLQAYIFTVLATVYIGAGLEASE
ncbi:MAG: F0F1 ATP synthase subunit A [Anaerolineae bacterium]|jgi:F-type H+-transporting ATPase subunit a|nr:F0F1 ATP synthase subunit A [Anaerolineae bacterium]MDH7474234.1 F0F1 ATP synthase subunit A [Anaerolineae bacterium]